MSPKTKAKAKTKKSIEFLSLQAMRKLAAEPAHLGIRALVDGEYVEEIQQRKKPRRYRVLKEIPARDVLQAALKKRHTRTVADLIESAHGECEELGEELQEWYDNMPESFQSGDKGDQLQQAIDELQGIDLPDVPDKLGEVEVVFYPWDASKSRADRRDEAVAEIEAAIDALEALDDEVLKEKEIEQADIETLVSSLEDVRSGAESVEFPGMY